MLIDEGELPLGTIAYECGFSSRAHFTMWFKQAAGTTPGECAKRHGNVLTMSVRGQVNDNTTAEFEQDQDTGLVLCAVSSCDREKLKVTGLGRILLICESKTLALASLQG